MILKNKFGAAVAAFAVVAAMAIGLLGSAPTTVHAAAGDLCKVANDAVSSILANSTGTQAITSVNSASSTTLRVYRDDVNAVGTVRVRVAGGSVNGTPATDQDFFFPTVIGTITGTGSCTGAGLPNFNGGAVAAAVQDTYATFSFMAPTLPSGVQSQQVRFQVDGDNDGDFTGTQDGTYFLTVSAAASSLSVGTPSLTAILADGTNASLVSLAVLDAQGANLAGVEMRVTTNLGVIDSNGTACTTPGAAPADAGSDADCTINSTGAAQTVALIGNGASGTATITITAGSFTATRTVIISGTATTIEVSGRRTNSATSFVAKGVVRANDSTAADGQDELILAAVAKDASGNGVAAGNVTFTLTGPSGHTVTLGTAAEQLTLTGAACSVSVAGTSCVDAIEAAAAGASTPAHAAAFIDIDGASSQPLGTYSVKAQIPGPSGTTLEATFTFEVVGAPATLTIPDGVGVTVGGTQNVVLSCMTADAKPCPSGSIVVVNVSSGTLIAVNTGTGTSGAQVNDLRTNDLGNTTVQLVGVAAGPGQIVANLGSVVASKSLTVGTTSSGGSTPTGTATGTATPVGPGTITGDKPPASGGGVGLFVFNGGTNAQLVAASGCPAATSSFYVTQGGAFLTYVPGTSIGAVNADWMAKFTGGVIPANTPMLGKCA